jgi:IS5 family transposase
MRLKINPQISLEFGPSHLKVTREYYEKYQRINEILSRRPEILEVFHREVCGVLNVSGGKRLSGFTSDELLRAILVMEIEGLPYRETVIRIDDSRFLGRFVGIPHGPVMDYTTLAKAYKAISHDAWKRINGHLGRYAMEEGHIEGRALRVDTTVCETDVHYPTDSSLLWDCYRVLSRWIASVREYDAEVVGGGRLQDRRVKRISQLIARRANQKEAHRWKLRRPYRALLSQVEHVLGWSQEVAGRCEACLIQGAYDLETARILQDLLVKRNCFEGRVIKVLDQAKRRVFCGEAVPNSEKIFSIFEDHTELIKRGKVSKPLEFGHMVLLGEVENKFISDYEVFGRRPAKEASLVDGIVERHKEAFGRCPESFTADRGFYESRERLGRLEEEIENVSIAKTGSRNEEEIEREHGPIFRALQRFRAGIEGTISYLKRCFKMCRCLYRSFKTYCSSVGSHIFAHNLVVPARL